MAKFHNNVILTLYGDDAPTEVSVRPRGGDSDLVALYASVDIRDAHFTVCGEPEQVRAFLNNLLDAVDEAMEPLTICQRRGKHNWEPSGPEDGCTDCAQEPLSAPVLVGNVPF